MTKTLCGIDEAGRGPVIGPLVIAGVKINEKNEDKLRELGVKDSKLLSPHQRELLFAKILETIDSYKILIISPAEVDAAVLSESTNLNWLEADKTAEIIDWLKPDKAILDCPSNNIKQYTAYIKNKISSSAEIIAEHKADFNYPVVSAASIIAKVTRDREIEKIKKKIGKDFGSGYPSDPITQEFLKENYKNYTEIFRKSWASYQDVARKKEQSSLKDF